MKRRRTAKARAVIPRSVLEPICPAMSAVIRLRRLRAGLSLGQLAKLTQLSRQALSFVESGRRVPTIDTVARISRALGVRQSRLTAAAECQAQL